MILAVCFNPQIARQIEGYMCNAKAIVATVPKGNGAHMRIAFAQGKKMGVFKDGDTVVAIHTMRSPDRTKEWTTRIVKVNSSEYSHMYPVVPGSPPVVPVEHRND